MIRPNRIDPIAKLNMALLPEPDNPNSITNNYRLLSFSTSSSSLPSIKFDYILTDKHRVSFLYSHFFSPATPSINTFEGVPGNGFPSESLAEYYRLNDDYNITPNLLNHLAIGYNHRHIIEAPGYVSNAPAAWAKATYIPGTVTPLAPGTSSTHAAGGVSWGNSVFTDSRQRTSDIKEQVSWIKGRHSFKFGMDYLKGIYRRLDNDGSYGTVSFSGAGTGNPNVGNSGSDWASFLLGVASGGGFRYPDDTAFSWPYYAWYVQDDFRVSQKFTLNVGLRYEIPVPKEERHHHNSNFCPNCPNAAAGGLPGAMIYAGVNGAPERFGQTRMNAFGPRLGMAYQIHSKIVIRAGGSIYYPPAREYGNADNGIQGFGGTFGAPGNFLSNGISYQVKDGFLPFAAQVAALRPPICRCGHAECGSPESDSVLLQSDRRPGPILRRLELHYRAHGNVKFGISRQLSRDHRKQVAFEAAVPESARSEIQGDLWKPSPSADQLGSEQSYRRRFRIQVAVPKIIRRTCNYNRPFVLFRSTPASTVMRAARTTVT